MADKFDYEKKMWGLNEVDISPKYLGATRFKYALVALEPLSCGKVLEVGCGGGAFTRAIKRHLPALEVVGSDISQGVLRIAGKMGGGVIYKKADVYNLPFKNGSFDAVVSFDVWEHLEEPLKAFKEANRILRPGGIFHFFVPTEGNKFSLYQLLPEKLYSFKRKYTGHIQPYDLKQLRRLLGNSNFKVREVYNSAFLLFQIVDLSYFLFLGMRGGNVSVSVEGYLQFARRTFFDKLLDLFKITFGVLTYFENELFWRLPGGGVHITAIKNEETS